MLPLASFVNVRGAIGSKTLDKLRLACEIGGATANTACGEYLHRPCPAQCATLEGLVVTGIESALGAAFAGQVRGPQLIDDHHELTFGVVSLGAVYTYV